MEKIPTAREILAKHAKNYEKTVEKDEKTLYHLSLNGFEAINAMIEFGKICVEAALKAANEKATVIAHFEEYDEEDELIINEDNEEAHYFLPYLDHGKVIVLDEKSILTAYPPEKII